jgi:epoxyqueuosine reductase
MDYLATERSRRAAQTRAKSCPNANPFWYWQLPIVPSPWEREMGRVRGRVASYAWGSDYHDILPARMKELVQFIEEQVGGPVKNRWYTDTGPILERDLAQRAGIGWIGKNTCLINPKKGSYFLLSEILLDLELEPDTPCHRPLRHLHALHRSLPHRLHPSEPHHRCARCISYLTIELKDDIPVELREKIGDWVFGCDICQMVCPWNRFAEEGDPAFGDKDPLPLSDRTELLISPRSSTNASSGVPSNAPSDAATCATSRLHWATQADMHALPVLQNALDDEEPLVREHAQWAIETDQQKVKAPLCTFVNHLC